MDKQDIRTLKILEELEQNQTPSQRDLARKLNVSLGLVNSFIKRLAHKGYFKVTNIPANRVKYILTPKGATEKTRLTYEYIKYSFEFYKRSRQKLRDLFQSLTELHVTRIVFYGVSELAEIAYVSLQEFPIELVAVLDDSKSGEVFLGHEVAEPSLLDNFSYDKVLVTVIGSPVDALGKLSDSLLVREKIVMIQ